MLVYSDELPKVRVLQHVSSVYELLQDDLQPLGPVFDLLRGNFKDVVLLRKSWDVSELLPELGH